MTQEELDALMAGDIDLDAEEEITEIEESLEEEPVEDEAPSQFTDDKQEDHYKVDAAASWPPPPPTNDHQVVNQLDDVTKDSEKKATEVFDKLENINNHTMNIENAITEQTELIKSNIAIFEKLATKFPDVESFQKALDENKKELTRCEEILTDAQTASDEVMMTMDIMQYQDIHRQKIERVINVMRALSGYMSLLFDSNKEDDKRVKSAIHIDGDSGTETVNPDDIEALIESFGK